MLWKVPIGRCFAAILILLAANPAWADCKVENFGTLLVDMVGPRATTVVKINGQDTRLLLDTGAFFSTMSRANAQALGLKLESPPFGLQISGLGGDASVDLVRVKKFGILGGTLDDVDFLAGGSDFGAGLIGANLLDIVDLDIDLAHGKLNLLRLSGCSRFSMAYWVQDGNYSVADLRPSDNSNERQSYVTVVINGKSFRAMLDTGAPATILSRRAAQAAGIDLSAPSVKASYAVSGIGAKSYKSWIAPIDTFILGDETIQHIQVQVFDGDFGEGYDAPDMLLGVDFFLAHHMFIANSQHKIYFTYNGGRVFSLDKPLSGSDGPNSAAGDANNVLKTAADYALRGEADLSRGEPIAAAADLDEAIKMAPDQAAYYFARARARLANRQPDTALTDLDKSLELDAKNVDALLLRARLRLIHKDSDGARTDVQAALRLAPVGSGQARTIAGYYITVDQPVAAMPLLDDWIRLHDDDAALGAVLNERCWARGLANQMLAGALGDCRKAIRRDGPKPDYLDSLGLVQLRLGNYPEAIKAYEQALAAMPDSAWSHYGRGLAEIQSGQIDTGKADLVAARGFDPQIDVHAIAFGLGAPATLQAAPSKKAAS